MKNSINAVMHDRLDKTKALTVPFSLSTQPILYFLVLVSTFLFNACKKYHENEVKNEDDVESFMGTNTTPEFLSNNNVIGATHGEVQHVRTAAANGCVNLNLKLCDSSPDII